MWSGFPKFILILGSASSEADDNLQLRLCTCSVSLDTTQATDLLLASILRRGCSAVAFVTKMRTMPAATAQWYVDESVVAASELLP